MESSPSLDIPNTIGTEDLAHQSPHTSPQPDQDTSFLSPSTTIHDYNFSGIYDDSSAPSAQDENTDEEMARLNGTETVSSRSSISSLPASVAPSAMIQPPDAITPTKSIVGDQDGLRNSFHSGRSPSRKSERKYGSPFRQPSSVRAMQMREDDEFSLTHRRRDSQMTGRTSVYSGRSSNTSSPTKRRARGTLAKEAKVKKEYPLVLLHCTLLPPTIPLSVSRDDHAALKAVLPAEYWRRWKLLNDKVLDNSEVTARGVLIPHPKGDYDLLEERLLESLELARARIRSGHYLGTESGETEHSESEEEEDVVQGKPCLDCGRKIVSDLETDRKWEIKVYAANGLMRAGAWSAVWNEMEKIDVEVGIWLPEEVRRDVETALREASTTRLADEELNKYEHVDQRDKEVYGVSGQVTQDEIDGLEDEIARNNLPEEQHYYDDRAETNPPAGKQIPHRTLSDLAAAYLKDLLEDRRNVLIAFLGVLALWLALTMGAKPISSQPLTAMEVITERPPPETVISVSTVTATISEVVTTTAAPGLEPTFAAGQVEEAMMEW